MIAAIWNRHFALRCLLFHCEAFTVVYLQSSVLLTLDTHHYTHYTLPNNASGPQENVYVKSDHSNPPIKSETYLCALFQIVDATHLNGGIYLAIDNAKRATDDFQAK